MQRGLSDSINICLLALTGLVMVALFSHSMQDPGWSFVGNEDAVQNLLGVAGAWLADSLYLVFGLGAWLLPLLLLHLVSRRLFGGPRGPAAAAAEEGGDAHPGLRGLPLLGVCLLLLAVPGLAELHFYEWEAGLPGGSGGLLGDGLGAWLLPWFGFLGASLLLQTVLLVGLTLAFSVNWGRLAELLGLGLLSLGNRLYRACIGLRLPGGRRRTPEAAPPSRKPRQHRTQETDASPGRPAAPPGRAKQLGIFDSIRDGSMPSVKLLASPDPARARGYSDADLADMSRLLEAKLKDYGIEAEVTSVLPGPVITRFEILPAPGVKVSRISALVKDLARSLAVVSVRIVEVIPGKPFVGVEIPNADRQTVRLAEVLSAPAWERATSPLSLALGHDIAGQPMVVDLAKMPHLLVAGTTGAGKSVGLNAMLLSLLYKARPDEVRLIMVDPKMLELSVYEGIPHLLTPVVTDMKDAAAALGWCVREMEDRYRLMAALGVRNITGFNRRLRDADEPMTDPLWVPAEPEDEEAGAPELSPLPYIVVVVDEFADMMMLVGKKVEELISRIAQKARAAGIHLILATQRPSVDVITGLIKANIPARIAYQVSSRVDSRTILDQSGAEQLLGHGDLLYLPAGAPLPMRVHGAFVSDEEVHAVVATVKGGGAPEYREEILMERTEGGGAAMATGRGAEQPEGDECYEQAVAFVMESRKASISAVQRKFRIGYNRAARIIEAMEQAGIVSPMNSNGSRDVLVPGRD